jgi:creatinine amidohydrolase
VLSGFRKLVVLNGHGGNTDSNNVVGLDFVNGLGHNVTIATGAYWDIARPALVEQGLMPTGRIPGHAGRFETSMVMALRPDLISTEGMARVEDQSKVTKGLFGNLTGATVQMHGAWAAGAGYTDNPRESTAEEGTALLEVVVERVSNFLVEFDQAA